MNTLTIWRFAGPGAAEQALAGLERMTAAGAVHVDDAALVSWPEGRRTPRTRQLGSVTGPGGLWGGFWGLLLSLVFLTPLAGPTFGAAAGAIAGSLADFGVADDFVRRVRDSVTPGSSAIFVVSTRAASNRIGADLEALGANTLRTDLSSEEEKRLRDALADR